jgi:NAD(P)-dependent dehydrogenase (short-subunit alcohol dehydrogenase family)
VRQLDNIWPRLEPRNLLGTTQGRQSELTTDSIWNTNISAGDESVKLKGKVAIITGGGTGIGKASALRFAQEGAKVVVAGLDSQPLEDVVKLIEGAGGEALPIKADVRIVDDTKRIVDESVKRFGALHILYNNAATIDLDRSIVDMTVEEWDGCLNASLRSVFLMSKWAGPEIRKAGGGSIINTASVGATQPWAEGGAYCSAKNGVIALTKVLALEFGPWNIRVNVISPGAIRTPNLERVMTRPGVFEKLCAKSVYRRVGAPEEIAATAVFLASDESAFMAGSNVLVDGGYLML